MSADNPDNLAKIVSDRKETIMLKKFKFHWLDGTVQVGKGVNVADAFTHMGYSAGAIRALDWYEILPD